MAALGEALARDGYAVVGAALSQDECEALRQSLDDIELAPGVGGRRHLLGRPDIQKLCRLPRVQQLIAALLGSGAFAYKATLFDKTPEANWKVAWHQDLSIPVCGEARPSGWNGWVMKDGITYVQPPAEVLAHVLAVRVHIDACDHRSGALRVIAGSHRHGRLPVSESSRWQQTATALSCDAQAGDLLLMRPLLLHASSASDAPSHRRVVHLEFAVEDLPQGLDWAERFPVTDGRREI